MAGRTRGTSPYHDDSYEDDYSDDFDDEATDAGGKRYKTRSPLLRSGESRRHHSRTTNKRQSVISESGHTVGGSKTYRKSKEELSQASGYHTPLSHNSQEIDDAEFYTPRTRVTADDVLMAPKPGKQSSLRAASEYAPHPASPRKHCTVEIDDETPDRSYRGRGRGKAGRLTGRMSTESKTDNITKRVLSARRLRINELQNARSESEQVIKDLKEEIKLLKKTQHRQDRALQRFEDRESDLPQLIQRQNNETRSMRDQIRKWREKYEKTDRYLRDAEDDLEKVKTKLKKLKSLADEKDLPERGDLNKKLNNQELELEAKDVKIKELERYIQNLEKNHRHELGIERARQKDIKKQFETIREENQKLSTTVEEKSKELQMKNIYANRMNKPPHRLPNSYNGTPHGTPPPRKRRPSLSGADGVTPRERAKQMEEKRREEMRKQRELKQKNKKSRNGSYLSDYSSPSRKHLSTSPMPNGGGSSPSRHKPPSRAHRDTSPSRAHRDTSPSRAHRDMSPYTYGEQQEKLRKEQELRKRREHEEREREAWERQEQERELEEKEQALNEQARRDDDERRHRDERDRMKRQSDEKARQERDRREKEDRERREKKEREERERKEKREREERERRERERLEQERRAQEERRRFEDDVSIQAEKKKKEEILQKLREIDEGVQKNRDKAKFNDPFFITDAKEDSMDSLASSKKSYTFSKPTENLHKGKPAHNEAFKNGFGSPSKNTGLGSPSKSTNRRRSNDKDLDSIETGGYNPTFGGKSGGLSLFDDEDSKPAKSNRQADKSKLMADLFGSSEPPKKQDDIFGSPSKKSDPSNSRPSFLFDDDASKSRKSLGTKRENSATLFGGGSALVNDEDLHKSQQRNAGMSRRQKQTTTAFHTRPTVNAVDHYDDDIEEVIL